MAAWSSLPPPATVYASTQDTTRQIDLADGSVIQLDRDSAIAVRFDENSRHIEVVRGRAMFDVGKDPARPLLVEVGQHVIEDIGTVFDVRRGTASDTVTVVNGQVAVHARPPLDRLRRVFSGRRADGPLLASLTHGEQVDIADGGNVTRHEEADIATTTAWLPDDIRFQHSTVADVARRFNRYTTQPLVVEDETIAQLRVSGVFHARDADAFLAYLATLPSVRIVRDVDRIRIVTGHAEATARTRRL
jgi:transmembrane sensor